MGGGKTLWTGPKPWSLLKPSPGPNRVTCWSVYLSCFCLLQPVAKLKTRPVYVYSFSIRVYRHSVAHGGSSPLPPKPSGIRPPMTVKHVTPKRLSITFRTAATFGTNPPRFRTTAFYSPPSHSFASITNVPLARTRALSPALTHPSSSGCPTLGTGSPIVGPRTHNCICLSVVVLHNKHRGLRTYQTLRISTPFDSTLINTGEFNLYVCGRRAIMPPPTLRDLALGSDL